VKKILITDSTAGIDRGFAEGEKTHKTGRHIIIYETRVLVA